jgi:valyl-tRNA synthetase
VLSDLATVPKAGTRQTLIDVGVRPIHPFMPYITEEIWVA